MNPRNWKTTAVGVLIILGVLVNAAAEYLQGHPVSLPTLGTGIMSGIGFIKAADAQK